MGTLGKDDLKQLKQIYIKEVSAMTNHEVEEVLKELVEQMDRD